jgi:transcription elongation factor GreA
MSAGEAITAEGLEALKEELAQLEGEGRQAIARRISAAREHGDLKENAEYHAAKDKQGMIMARIALLEQSLSRAEVIDPSKLSGSKIQFGAKIKLLNVDTEEEQTFQIVGPEEADIKIGRISVASPLARGLLGHEVGEEVKVVMPAGPRTYEILAVSFV